MEAIYPISALQKDAQALRKDAATDIVRLTVDGRGAYVFASEQVFEDYVQRRVDEAVMEQRVLDALSRGVADEAAGRTIPADEGWERVWEQRGCRAAG